MSTYTSKQLIVSEAGPNIEKPLGARYVITKLSSTKELRPFECVLHCGNVWYAAGAGDARKWRVGTVSGIGVERN